MKKIILTALICIFVLCGCGKKNTDKKYIDYNYMFREGTGELSISSSGKGYYFAINNMLCYTDANNMKLVPVCSRVDCTHEYNPEQGGLSSDCDAYIGSQMTWFGQADYYDGYIYTASDITGGTTNFKLWKISPDGIKKESIMNMKACKNMGLHRGNIYYIETVYDIEHDNNNISRLCKKSLSGGDADIIYKTSNMFVDMVPYGEYVYFEVQDDEDKYDFMRFDIKSGEIIKAEIPDEAVRISHIQFAEDGLVFAYWYGRDDERNCQIYSSGLDFTGVKELFRLTNPNAKIGYDGKYYYEDNYMDKEVYQTQEKSRQMIIYDDKFNKVDTVDFGNTGGYLSGYGDSKFLFVRTDENIYYFDKAEIGSGNITVKRLR